MAATWVDTWLEVQEGIAAVNGGRFVAVPNAPTPLESDAVAQITRGQAEAMGETWRRVAAQAGNPWVPLALPDGPPGEFLPPELAGDWWASTLTLARQLDAAGVPAAGYTTQWDSSASAPAADDGSMWPLLALAGVLVFLAARRHRRTRHN